MSSACATDSLQLANGAPPDSWRDCSGASLWNQQTTTPPSSSAELFWRWSSYAPSLPYLLLNAMTKLTCSVVSAQHHIFQHQETSGTGAQARDAPDLGGGVDQRRMIPFLQPEEGGGCRSERTKA
jgi:hypothetical protein